MVEMKPCSVLILITCSCLLAASQAQSNDTTVEGSAGVFVKVLGESGKVIVGWKQDVQTDNKRVELALTSLQELNSALQNVQPKTGQHSFTAFSSQRFTATPVQQGSIGDTGIQTSFFTSTTGLAGLNTTVTITVFLINGQGSLTLDGEMTPVKRGDVKMDIEVESWTWCSTSTCQSEGAYLDMTLTVISQRIPQKKAKDNSTGDADAYNLGYGSLLLSKKVKVDGGSWQNMAANYPQLKTVGDDQVLHIRLPKFSKHILYDPTVSGEMSADQVGTGSHLTVSSLLLTLVLLPALCKMLVTP